MSIKPIDLQTLFVNMNHVGKEQALTRAGVHHSQDLHAEKIIKLEDHRDHSVNEVNSEDVEAAKIHKDGNSSPEFDDQNSQKKQKDAQEEEKPKKNSSYKDPLVGQKIDLEG